MQLTIDGAGRLVVPKALRDRLGLVSGSSVDLVERGGQLVLTPVGPRIGLEEREGRQVFVTEESAGSELTDRAVRSLVEESRQWPRD